MKLGIIDYGMGNIFSLKAAIKEVSEDIDIEHTSDVEVLDTCDKLLLPGVGNFRRASELLENLSLKDYIVQAANDKKVPLMGICLGMQLLFEYSEEDGGSNGLGLLEGKVKQFDISEVPKVPHVGFNAVEPHPESVLYKGITHLDFYFIHSLRVKASECPTGVIGTCNYGEDFVASIEHNNIFGTQFHPEKSQSNGLQLLSNFLTI